MVSKPKKCTTRLKRNKIEASKQQKLKPEKNQKLNHKKKIEEVHFNDVIQQQTKVNMKKTLSKLDKQSLALLQLLEERRNYIIESVIKGNQQFEEDKNSQWYCSNFEHEEISSSPLPNYCLESNDISDLQGQRKVQFVEESPEVHHLTVHRALPGKDHPIFDEKKTWISQLMSKKPKKSTIKIQVNKIDMMPKSELAAPFQGEQDLIETYSQSQINTQLNHESNLLWQKKYCEYLNINPNTLFDMETLRVLYEDNNDHILVNTLFSYTH